jgi:hypothetical protein
MELTDGRIKLTSLAAEFGVTPQALRNHLKNSSGLGVNAIKLNGKLTGEYLLSIDSVLNFIHWSYSNGRKLNLGLLERVEKEIKWLKKQSLL